jgi:hypothetical protein
MLPAMLLRNSRRVGVGRLMRIILSPRGWAVEVEGWRSRRRMKPKIPRGAIAAAMPDFGALGIYVRLVIGPVSVPSPRHMG